MKFDFDVTGGNQVYDHLYVFDTSQELIINTNNYSVLKLKNVITFPGITNSHDHLEFNLFPFLGAKKYDNYKSWGADIHKQYKKEIDDVLAIPVSLRIKWGILKNLINGVTAIVHHGKHHNLIKNFSYPVYLDYQYFHALHTEFYWKIKLTTSFSKKVMIHVGEGIETQSNREISELIRWNVFNRKLIGIHAIAMDIQQSKKFEAIVWCPDSNLKLYGKTAPVDQLKNQTTILFGTDSTLSASANMWEHLHVARKLALLSDKEIYNSLVINPAKIFASFASGSQVVAKKKYDDPWDAFFELQPEDLLLVTVNNKIMLADCGILDLDTKQYSAIRVGGSEKWIINELAMAIYELEKLGVSLPLNVSTSKREE